MRRITTFLIVVLSALFQTTHAAVILDEPVLGGTMIVATDGNVTATYLGSDAGYFNSLYLDAPGAPARFLFSKWSPVGLTSTIDLGWFVAGTELTFRLDVWNTGKQFFTGAGLVNPDGLPHALAVTRFDAGLFLTDVGFEDLFGGGDRDYNDFMFRLTNVYDPPGVPEPGTLALLGLGLAGIGAVRRRRTVS